MNRRTWKRRRMKERSRWSLKKQKVVITIGLENRFEYICLYMLFWSRLPKFLPSCTSPQESNSSSLNMICNICALFEIPFQFFFLVGGSCFITFFSFLLFGVVCAFFLLPLVLLLLQMSYKQNQHLYYFWIHLQHFFSFVVFFFQGVHKSHM